MLYATFDWFNDIKTQCKHNLGWLPKVFTYKPLHLKHNILIEIYICLTSISIQRNILIHTHMTSYIHSLYADKAFLAGVNLNDTEVECPKGLRIPPYTGPSIETTTPVPAPTGQPGATGPTGPVVSILG